MGRLIDADVLRKYLRDYKWEFAMGSDFSKAMEMIDAQPIAYDVENVVDEVRKYDHRCDDCRAFNCSECEFMKLIDAIRKGGVE